MILSQAASRFPQPALNQWVRGVALSVAVICLLGGLAFLAHRMRAHRGTEQGITRGGSEDRSGGILPTAALLTLATLSLLALVPVYLLAAQHESTSRNLGRGPPFYGFLDKRWLLAAFLLGTLGSMLTIAVSVRVVEAAQTTPGSWREWVGAVFGSRTSHPEQSNRPAAVHTWKRQLGLTVLAFALATYFFGPPWHVPLDRAIDGHETTAMGGVQAIATGAVPYIGSAAIQYGPGSELIPYLYLSAGDTFDLEGLRQSTVLLFWLAATIFFATIFLRLRPKLALITCLVSACLFPCLQLIHFSADGSVNGSFGWANAMRYVGVFALAMLLPAVAAIGSRRRALASAVTLGVVWGFTCYMAQENLIGGVVALGVLSVLLTTTRTRQLRSVMAALAAIGVGFFTVAIVVLAFYAASGDLSRFLELYFLVPQAVASGYSNTPYLGGFADPWGPMYYLLPFLLGALCLLSLVRLHPLRLARQWSPQRVLFVSALVAAVVTHTGALTRADATHLINTMIALPVVVILAVAYLPSLLGIRSSTARSIIAVGTAGIAVALMPLSQLEHAAGRLWWPLEARISYDRPALENDRVDPGSVAASRIGPELVRKGGACCTGSPVSMHEFATLINRLHALLGDKRVYIAELPLGTLYPGAAYFLADLRPAPMYLERATMAVNEDILKSFYDYYREHLDEVDAVATVNLDIPEVGLFERTYPDHRTTVIPYHNQVITILTR